MKLKTPLMIVAIAVLLLATASAQDFRWNGGLAAGLSIEIKGVNGDVVAVPSESGEVVVTATKSARRSDPDGVRIEVVEHAGGVTICAVYPTPEGNSPNTCEPGKGGRNSTRNNDVKVNFRVQVPQDVDFVGRTVNGDVQADSIPSNVLAVTVNGDVEIGAFGYAQATTVNGDIVARIGDSSWEGEVEFETVNGDIRLHFNSSINAELAGSTVNGDIESDVPLEVKGKWGPKSFSGTIGSGGRKLSATTVNGSIEISEGT